MLDIAIIGNLTSDAAIKDWKGKQFVSFSIAENQAYTDADGVKHEKTTYVSCLKPVRGENGSIAQYLKKGTQVFVRGRASTKVFTRNDGSMDASLNCNADYIQLLGSPRKEQNSPSDGFSQPSAGNLSTQPSNAPQTARETISRSIPPAVSLNDEVPF